MVRKERTYPAFPIPAVGAVILNQERVLLIQRGQPPSQGKWTLPGGVVELGESPEDALIREVQEECYLDIRVMGILAAVNRVIRDEQQQIQYHYIILDYLARCCDHEPNAVERVRPGSDAQAARWVSLSEIMQYELTEGLPLIIRAGIAKQAQWSQYSTTEDCL